MQNSFDPRSNYGPSDFDTRHRITVSGIYELPFRKTSRLFGGWQVSPVLQAQTGNPFTILTGGNFVGTTTIRPNQLGPVTIANSNNANGTLTYFTAPTCAAAVTSGCVLQSAGNVFGTMKRNAVVGPGFLNLDLSAIKRTKITERVGTEFRVEAFNVLNHPNFAQPITAGFLGAVMTSATFGQVTSTRFPTGDAGSSRQLQVALKLTF
jgi:hypothetical protein